MISGVYKITSLVKPDRCYIGSSNDIHKRWEVHLRELKNHKHHAVKLQRHFDKYSKNDLVFSILIGCDKEELVNTEQYFLDVYKPYFNSTFIAYKNIGFTQTEEAKRKISEAQMGEKNPNYHRQFSDEHRRKISEARKGKANNKGFKWSDESKQKLSEALKGKRNSPSTEFKKGCTFSEEHNKKISEALKGRVPWNKGIPIREESRQKLIASVTGKPHPNKGHKHSEAEKKHLSEVKTKYYQDKKLEQLKLTINNN